MCDAGSSPTSTVASRTSPYSAISPFSSSRMRAASARPSIAVAAGTLEGHLDAADVEAERLGKPDADLEVLLQALDVTRLHHAPDPRALPRSPEGVRCEFRQQTFRGVYEPALRLLVGVLEQNAFVRHAGAVVDPVVRGQPVADLLEDGAARRARDQPEAPDDQPLVEHLHQEDFFLEGVRLERHVREVVEMRVAFGRTADFGDELEPGLGVA